MAKKEVKKEEKPDKQAKLDKQEDHRGFMVRRGPLLISLAIMFLFIAYTMAKKTQDSSRALSALALIEAKAFDIRFQIMNRLIPQPPAPEVVIAAIDDRAVDALGWPFPRKYWAEFLRRMEEYGARVVAFDVVFDQEGKYAGYKFIADSMRKFDELGLEQSPASCGNYATRAREFRDYLGQAEQSADYDRLFAEQLQKMKNTKVVLGWYGYVSPEEVQGLTDKDFADNAEMISSSSLTFGTKGVPENMIFKVLAPSTLLGLATNTPVISKAGKYFGFFVSKTDDDGIIRSAPLLELFSTNEQEQTYNPDNTFVYPALALSAVSAFLQGEGEKPQVTISTVLLESILLGDRQIRTDERGRILINWVGPQYTFPYYSIYDILGDGDTVRPMSTDFDHPRPPVEKVSAFKGKIVLVGSTAVGAHDMRNIPFGTAPGVEMHANIVSNILKNNALIRPTWFRMFDVLILIVLAMIFAYMLPRLSAITGGIATLVLFFGYIVLNFYLFSEENISFTIVSPMAEMLLIYSGITIFHYATEEREKQFIKHTFSHYLSPAIIEQLVNDPSKLKLGGERKVCTAFFSDIQGFSSISEKMAPEELVPFLNEYLTEMCDIIYKFDGTVDKFEGDAIIAFFGAPIDFADHAARACKCAVEIQRRMVALRKKWLADGKPEIFMRIGLNTGPMVIGNMGSATRMDYTMMGDSVNLAARLESGGKQYKLYTLISEFTKEAAGEVIETREIDMIQVVGKAQPVRVYEVLGNKGQVEPLKRQVADLFEQGLKLYRERYWKEAKEKFSQALQYDPAEGPSKIFISRCDDFALDPPPPGWDGVYSMKSK